MVQAQQDPMFTHFTYNKLFYNPAYAGASGQYCLNAITHQQWLGFDDQTSYLRTQNGDPINMDLDKMRTNIAPQTMGLGFSAPAMYTKITEGLLFPMYRTKWVTRVHCI